MKKYTLLVICLFIAFSNAALAQNIVINEILSSNNSNIMDEDGTRQDWIELYNAGASAVNLNGYGLSDDPLVLYKWTFPNVSVAAGQYLLIWASNKNRAVAGSPLHTNFKINATGDSITLTNTAGVAVDNVPPVALQPDISYGRLPNGTGPFVFFGVPTPNAVNSTTGYSGILNPPIFSQASGFLTSGFNLTISSSDPGTSIIYTLDGSEPDPHNLSGTTYSYKNQYPQHVGQATGPLLEKSFKTLQYSAPISIVDRTPQPNKISTISSTYDYAPPYFPNGLIYKGNVVKAMVIKPGSLSSRVVTKNYFISPQGNSRFTLPVLSLSVDENKLFDYTNGIFVAGKVFDDWRTANPASEPDYEIGNFARNGIANERMANLNYFVNGLEVINEDVGIRIHGSYSRTYPNKSFNIYARSDYGSDKLRYKFFSDQAFTSYDRVTVKNFGSDFYNTLFRDALNFELVKSLRLETEAYQPVIEFINGEYYGILGMREHYDSKYFLQSYNIPETQIDLLENDASTAYIQEGDNVDYLNMISYVQNNSLVSDANYAYIKTRLEPESFTDYFISNIYFQNRDWPGNNIVFWRKKTAGYVPNAPYGHDGRWRWAIHDMDSTFGDASYNALADATSSNGPAWPNPPWSTLLLRKLLANVSFKNDFINRFADLMNTSFLPSRIISVMDPMEAALAPEINEQMSRWNTPAGISDWNYFIDAEKNFVNARPTVQRTNIRSQFAISSNINVTLNVSNASQGYIKINTINIIDGTPGITGNPYPWTGIYFKNIPLTLNAIAKPGFVFSNWTGASNSTNPVITITPSATFAITAVFSPVSFAEISVPVYFWMMDGSIVNGAQLTSLNSTYQLPPAGVIHYQSCISGYPFPSTDVNYGKASMERRNSPIDINYRPEANNNLTYAASAMKGLQIKEPLQKNGLENTMIFNFSTAGYKNIKLSYAAINELTTASAISVDYSVNAGTSVWITTGLATTSLPLTAVFQLFQSDFSAITTVNNNPDFKVRLRFTGTNMTVDTGARITFNNIALDGVKIPLTYPTPNVFNVGNPISNLSPSITETVVSYSVSPSLPAGLSINTSTGVISGTPTAATPTATFTVTATNSGGSTTFDVVITVNGLAPGGLSYPSPNIFIKNTTISNLSPTVAGNVSSYNVSPGLPAGLSLNTSTGVISGTPTSIAATATYTVTATNSGGSTSFGVIITVNDVAPSGLSYSSPNIFTKDTVIPDLNPTISGNVSGYGVSPGLPAGLFLNTSTGVISGTPIATAATATYTVTANNSSGSTSFGVIITVNDVAPRSLSYPSPNVFTKNTTVTNLNPTISGGTVLIYSISPNLSSGLYLNNLTGVISGIPSSITATTTYTVTAINSGGSISFDVIITINDVAPNFLTYPSPNLFLTGNAISNLFPSFSGLVITFNVSPNLPEGLTLNLNTGMISGTPMVATPTATYIVTATNSGGSTSYDVVISVQDLLGVNESNYSTFQLFPNPFNYIIYFTGPITPTSFKMYTVDGKLIQEGRIKDSQIEFNGISNGMYLLELHSGSKIQIKKIIKH